MSGLAESILETQNNYEQRFNCAVCLCPKLHMVYGYCQHHFCVDCLYDAGGNIRTSMIKCPTCQMDSAFPKTRPDIPDDNLEMMRCLGVQLCENKGCDVELWQWELEDHVRSCPNRVATPKTPYSRHRVKPESSKSTKKAKKESVDSPPTTRQSGNVVLRRLRSFRRSSLL
ncbi:uncharacterized protein [Haliotis cracherodii]|uniref:uncharacterized protein n=1 Tax=Haliotis cracherodii TaxID=6455 RepID=UPI0039EB36B1